jgi:hypothetical protein
MIAPDVPPTAPMRRFADRARVEPALLGARLEAIKTARGWGDAALAAALGTTPEALVVVRLCSPPQTSAQCELVAARGRLSAAALARLLDVAR